MKNKLKTLLLIFSWILFGGQVQAYVRIPDILSDSMIIQRNSQVPVWGTALPGEAVSVSFDGQIKRVVTDEEGNWKVLLEVKGADFVFHTITIEGINTLRLKGVMIGEVWLCSGQSNMQLTLADTDKGDSVIASANYPTLRLFNISRDVSFKHRHGRIGNWESCTPESVKPFSAAAYYFSVRLMKRLKVPVGVINASFGGSQAEAWVPREYLHTPDLQPCLDREVIWRRERAGVQQAFSREIKEWKEYAAKEHAAGRNPKGAPHQPEALREYRIAGSIYEAMIAPVIPYGIKGIIWYQGESNEGRAEQYGILLPVLIEAWRAKWEREDLPFGIVQLPNFRSRSNIPEDAAWSHLREEQRVTTEKVLNTGLIVTIDIGEGNNIHPRNKLDLGKRMSQWALADVYHLLSLPGGPRFDKAVVSGSKIIVSFKDVGTGMMTRDHGVPHEFAIAGEDRKWYWARARILDKNRVEVWSDQVKKPVEIRYAFNNNPQDPNVTNDTGIPAAPFRTDHWPGPTHGKR